MVRVTGCGVGVGVGAVVGVGVEMGVDVAVTDATVAGMGVGVLPMSTAHPTKSIPSPAVAAKRSSSNLVRGIGLLFARC